MPRGSAVYQRVVPSLSVIGKAPWEYATKSVSGSNATDRMSPAIVLAIGIFCNHELNAFATNTSGLDHLNGAICSGVRMAWICFTLSATEVRVLTSEFLPISCAIAMNF